MLSRYPCSPFYVYESIKYSGHYVIQINLFTVLEYVNLLIRHCNSFSASIRSRWWRGESYVHWRWRNIQTTEITSNSWQVSIGFWRITLCHLFFYALIALSAQIVGLGWMVLMFWRMWPMPELITLTISLGFCLKLHQWWWKLGICSLCLAWVFWP